MEATLLHPGSDGITHVAPTGGTRMLVKRVGANRVDLIKLRSAWIGLIQPNPDDQFATLLNPGDELILATDGLHDQLDAIDHLDLSQINVSDGLLMEHIDQLLELALRDRPQKDDITVVGVVYPFQKSSKKSIAGHVTAERG